MVAGENFSEVESFYSGVLTVEGSLNVHETAVVTGCAGVSSGVEDGRDFLFQHRAGDPCILDSERSSEAAASLDAVEFDEVDSADGLQEAKWAVAEGQTAEAVTAGVVGDAVRKVSTNVLEAETAGEKLREFKYPGKESFDVGGEATIVYRCDHLGIVIAHHSDAGRRGYDDDLGCAELVDEALQEGESVGLIARIPVHLPATGLACRKLHGMSQSLQDMDHGFTCFGKQSVVVTGYK